VAGRWRVDGGVAGSLVGLRGRWRVAGAVAGLWRGCGGVLVGLRGRWRVAGAVAGRSGQRVGGGAVAGCW